MLRMSVFALVMWACISEAALAQTSKFPIKPIRMIIGYTPGGGTDIIGRLIAEKIAEETGQQVIVENRPGATQNLAAEFVARSPNDGYTLFLSSSAHGINISLFPKLNYDPVKDFAPVALVGTSPNLFLVHPSLPVRSVTQFITLGKKNPNKLNFASAGSGTSQHLSGEMFKVQTGVGMVHIPYKGSLPSMTALISGEVELMFCPIPPAMPLMAQGRLRGLAITSAARSALLPELPTMIESGLPGFVSGTWFGVFLSAGTPKDIVAVLNAIIVKAVRKEEFRARLAQLGVDPVAESPDYLAQFLKDEIKRWAVVIKASKAKAE